MNKMLSVFVVLSLLASGAEGAAGDSGQTDGGFVPAAGSTVSPLAIVPIATINGVWNATSPAGTQTGRTNRNGVGSTCNGAALTTPLFTAATVQSSLSALTFSNPYSAPTCFTFTLINSPAATCGFNLQPNLYLGTFNPANPIQNWIGTAGLSSGFSPTNPVPFNVLLPAGAAVVYVLNNVNATDPAATACTFRVDITANVDVPVPVLSLQTLAALMLLLSMAGYFGYRRYAQPR